MKRKTPKKKKINTQILEVPKPVNLHVFSLYGEITEDTIREGIIQAQKFYMSSHDKVIIDSTPEWHDFDGHKYHPIGAVAVKAHDEEIDKDYYRVYQFTSNPSIPDQGEVFIYDVLDVDNPLDGIFKYLPFLMSTPTSSSMMKELVTTIPERLNESAPSPIAFARSAIVAFMYGVSSGLIPSILTTDINRSTISLFEFDSFGLSLYKIIAHSTGQNPEGATFPENIVPFLTFIIKECQKQSKIGMIEGTIEATYYSEVLREFSDHLTRMIGMLTIWAAYFVPVDPKQVEKVISEMLLRSECD